MKTLPLLLALLLVSSVLTACRSRPPATASYVDFQCICGDMGKRAGDCRHPDCAAGRRNPDNPDCRCGER